MKWEPPIFASIQSRFSGYEIPPSSNANFAFILTGLDFIEDKAAFLLPLTVLNTKNKEEIEIKKRLIERNLLEAVILLPDTMFETTTIQTLILLFNKNKTTLEVEIIDMSKSYILEKRAQKGQYGGASHENRTYYKTNKVITEEAIASAIQAIQRKENTPNFCKSVSLAEIREHDYDLMPKIYIGSQNIPQKEHRPFKDIAADYNRVVQEKNSLKLTVNESVAKSLGLYEVFTMMKNSPDIAKSFACVGEKAEKENFISLSKNKAEFKIENKSIDKFPEILSLFLQMWKSHIMYLNNEGNRLLAEFRDALLPELMEGKIDLTSVF